MAKKNLKRFTLKEFVSSVCALVKHQYYSLTPSSCAQHFDFELILQKIISFVHIDISPTHTLCNFFPLKYTLFQEENKCLQNTASNAVFLQRSSMTFM